ncbi:CoA ester lyase [Microbacterium sp. STN6]|uniref:HpcH/HpaI aldolase/citrate lyase family protein n=1 Tax=Microbacterium sp. STN6 TaxID=2995588 RepID=UPI002260FF0A|nr:CoA ester lyase [Microbacterium sp. STN6]MCX7521290.1 CoA ester lyase [Microbacterium sp. STN6]
MTAFELGPALLFCPADRPDRYEKAAARADAVILDLEDAVTPDARPAAREALRRHPLDASRTIVRLNELGTNDSRADAAAASAAGYRYVMVPKADDPDAVAALEFDVIALCETAAGVLAAERLAGLPNVVALMWGAEDLVASLGGTSSRHPDGRYREVVRHARSAVLLAAAAAGKAAIDTVHLDIAALEALADEASDAAAVGFTASACIHPGQVETIRAAYRPSADELAFARDVLAAAEGRPGAFAFRGSMVDAPLLRHARQVVARSHRHVE